MLVKSGLHVLIAV